jgi:hypothetical protein
MKWISLTLLLIVVIFTASSQAADPRRLEERIMEELTCGREIAL